MVDVPHPPSGGHTYRVTPNPSRSGQRPGLSQLVATILADLFGYLRSERWLELPILVAVVGQ